MLSGEFNAVLDDRNRITLPAQLRKELAAQLPEKTETIPVFLSKGDDNCLWLHSSDKWNEMIANPIKKFTNPFSNEGRRLLRKYVGASQTIEVDKAGRILISEGLLEYSGISKECVVIGQLDYIEIWDKERYLKYCNEDDKDNEAEFFDARIKLGQRIDKDKGIE